MGLGDPHTLAEARAIAQQEPTHSHSRCAGEQARWDDVEQRFAALTAARVK